MLDSLSGFTSQMNRANRLAGLFIRQQAAGASYVFSVCTGALLCRAAGLLQGRRATTQWAALAVLPYYGATVSTERVVVYGSLIIAGGIRAGIDGALQVAALLRGDTVAQEIQLDIDYDPHPVFSAGSPATGRRTACRAGPHPGPYGAPPSY
jgi:cyclohexyl-isocyanide hydratase